MWFYTIIPLNDDENWIMKNKSMRVLKDLRSNEIKGWMKCSALFEAEEIFYLPVEQKREYMDMISDVKYIHSRKYIYQKEKYIYGVPKWYVT